MKYKLTYVNELHAIERRNLSDDTAIAHFVKHGYDFLYIFEREELLDVLSYQDFLRYGLEPRERPYLQDFSQLKDDTAIRNFFQQNHNINRCALIKNGRLFGEVNTLTEPPLIHSVLKNLLALRYIQIFSREVADYFSSFNKVILFAPKQIQAELVARFPQTTFANVTDPEAIRKLTGFEADLIMDFLFGKKLLKKIGCNVPVMCCA